MPPCEILLLKIPDFFLLLGILQYYNLHLLDYEVLAYDADHDCTLISVSLKTGRHHQIRVQFASRGHYLLGDQRYGVLDHTQICLFSYYLSFEHPVTKELLEFKKKKKKTGYWTSFTL